jgi:hypothetical protein
MIRVDPYIINVLMRDLVGHDRRPATFLVYLWLAAEAQRQGSDVQIGYRELAEDVGLSKSAAQSAVGWLIKRRLLSARKANATALPSYKILSPWKGRRTAVDPL